MHLLICLGEDKYLLMLPGIVLICLNSAQRHYSKLTTRALLTQPQVLNLSAHCDWRPASLHTVSWTLKSFHVQSHVINATHLTRMKEEVPQEETRRGCHGPLSVQGLWGEELNMIELHCTDVTPPENMGLYYPETFVPTQPSCHWHVPPEKPGTETTSELSCELHIVQKPLTHLFCVYHHFSRL